MIMELWHKSGKDTDTRSQLSSVVLDDDRFIVSYASLAGKQASNLTRPKTHPPTHTTLPYLAADSAEHGQRVKAEARTARDSWDTGVRHFAGSVPLSQPCGQALHRCVLAEAPEKSL